MSDLISKSALLEEFEWLKMTVGSGSVGSIKDAIERIKKAPAVDAVEVIHCRECEHWRPSPFRDPVLGWCIVAGHHRRPDYYCADADPKEGK